MVYGARHGIIVVLSTALFSVFTLFITVVRAQLPVSGGGPVLQLQISEEARLAVVHYNEGVRRENLGNIPGAVEQFQTTLTYDSLFIPAHEHLQHIFFIQGKEDSVKTEYEKWTDIYPENIVYRYLAARLLAVEEAESAFQDIIQRDSLFYWGYFGLGQNYLTRGLFEEAAEQFQKAVEINPVVPDFQLALGIAYENLEQHDLAQRQYEKTLLINQKVVPEAYFHLGMLYIERADTTRSLENLRLYLDYVAQGSQADLARAYVDSIEVAFARAAMMEELMRLEEEAKKEDKKD